MFPVKLLFLCYPLMTLLSVMPGCGKSEPCPYYDLVITTNSPVKAGDTLKISVSGYPEPVTYRWTAGASPNQVSDKRELIIPNATAKDAGRYYVHVSTPSACGNHGYSDSVEIR